MGKHKKISRPKSTVTVRDPHFSEYDTQSERNTQTGKPKKPSHP